MNYRKGLKSKKAYLAMGAVLLLMLFLTGCGKKTEAESAVSEQTEDTYQIPDNQKPSLQEVMDRILTSRKLDEAVDYENTIEGELQDTLVLLCKSESGKYEAYGFISAEYGKNGLLINNIIDGESNWNYFEENWSYGEERPAFEEKGDYEVAFTFTQEDNGVREARSLYFDTYDTGTMSVREQR